MGRFSTTVQIKSNAGREQFTGSFCEIMKKRGFAKCSEDEASVSYALAFSNSWVTVACGAYKDNPKQAQDDVKQIAENMGTSGFAMDVIDSDWAIINLFVGTDTQDTVIVGRSEFPDEPPKGNPECWNPLIVSGKSWDDLLEIWNRDETFVEDTLCEAAEVLGINPQYMVSDFEELESEAEKNQDVTLLCFKKTEKKSTSKTTTKPLTLNAAFKQVFGEALEPLGFKKVKCRHPYFARVVSDEILHIISVRKEYCSKQFYSAFAVYCGVATVYRKVLRFDQSFDYNRDWMDIISKIYRYSDDFEYERDKENLRTIYDFEYKNEDDSSLIDTMTKAVALVKTLVVPAFDKAVNLSGCVEYYSKYRVKFYFVDERKMFGNDNPNNDDNEGLILVLVKPGDEYFERKLKRCVENLNFDLNRNVIDEKTYKSRLQSVKGYLLEQKNSLNGVISNDTKLKLAQRELTNRKVENIEKLKGLGLI